MAFVNILTEKNVTQLILLSRYIKNTTQRPGWIAEMTSPSAHSICHFACDLICRAIACGDIFLPVCSRTAWSIHAILCSKIHHNSWLYFATFICVVMRIFVTYAVSERCLHSLWFYCKISSEFPCFGCCFKRPLTSFLQPSHNIDPFFICCHIEWYVRI